MKEQFDPARFEALEEVTFHTSNSMEALLNLLIEKGLISERELMEKIDTLMMPEDEEELGFDADSPRDRDD
jgi:hypothetical protein